jgi:hypothetical protein
MSTERLLLAEWKEEIASGVAAGKLVRLGRTVTLHSRQVGDDDTPGGAKEMLTARVELAAKLVAENPGVSVAVLAERAGVSLRTVYRARRASGA